LAQKAYDINDRYRSLRKYHIIFFSTTIKFFCEPVPNSSPSADHFTSEWFSLIHSVSRAISGIVDIVDFVVFGEFWIDPNGFVLEKPADVPQTHFVHK
jgi:hypothetical protein